MSDNQRSYDTRTLEGCRNTVEVTRLGRNWNMRKAREYREWGYGSSLVQRHVAKARSLNHQMLEYKRKVKQLEQESWNRVIDALIDHMTRERDALDILVNANKDVTWTETRKQLLALNVAIDQIKEYRDGVPT